MEITKQCFECNKVKALEDFHKHSGMKDGHLNKCKDCICKDVRSRHAKNMEYPEYAEKEKNRGKEKYHRLGYKSLTETSAKKFPWKKLQSYKNLSRRFPLPKGIERHHWNYEKIEDFIPMARRTHRLLHNHLELDVKRKIFKTKDGEYLDTKEKHIKYAINVLGFDPQYVES